MKKRPGEKLSINMKEYNTTVNKLFFFNTYINLYFNLKMKRVKTTPYYRNLINPIYISARS